jgi:SAM-dependent methyltransferase
MTGRTSLIRRAVTVLDEEGPASLARRAGRLGRVKFFALLKEYRVTRRLYDAFFDSSTYWEGRYAAGGDSGVGSHGEYAEYKAEILNEFVAEHDIESVIEFGCGDGNQIALAEYPEYVGLEVSKAAIESCSRRFADDDTKSFFLYDPQHFDNNGALEGDLVLSLEVLFHIVDREEFENALDDIFEASRRYVIVFSSNRDDPEPDTVHVKHRNFTEYVAETFPEFELINTIGNDYDARVSDFYIYEKRPADD